MIKRGILVFILVLVIIPAFAQKKSKPDSLSENWHIRISPYFWYVGFKGTIYSDSDPAPSNPIELEPEYEFDIGFKELRSSIKFALMLSGEQRTKYTYSRFHFFGLILEGDAITPIDLIFQNVNLRMSYFGGDVAIGYRFIKNKKLELDGTLGLKWSYIDVKAKTNILGEFPIYGERDKFWIDPVMGVHVAWKPVRRLEIVSYSDIGFFIGNQLTYQSVAEVNYFFSRRFYMSFGYRIWGIETPQDDAIFNGLMYGWITRIGFQF